MRGDRQESRRVGEVNLADQCFHVVLTVGVRMLSLEVNDAVETAVEVTTVLPCQPGNLGLVKPAVAACRAALLGGVKDERAIITMPSPHGEIRAVRYRYLTLRENVAFERIDELCDLVSVNVDVAAELTSLAVALHGP